MWNGIEHLFGSFAPFSATVGISLGAICIAMSCCALLDMDVDKKQMKFSWVSFYIRRYYFFKYVTVIVWASKRTNECINE